MTASQSGSSLGFGAFVLVLASMAGSAGCSDDTEAPSDPLQIAPDALRSETVGTSVTSSVPLDANGDVDWNAVSAACQTLYDVASISETEVYFACGEQGLLHLTPDGIDTWTTNERIFNVKAASRTDIRVSTCHDVYRRGLLGGWSKEGMIGDPQSSGCGGLVTGGGGWFGSVWHPVPEYGELWRFESGAWVGQHDKYNFGLSGAFFDMVAFGRNDVIISAFSPNAFVAHAKFDIFNHWKIVSQTPLNGRAIWRAPGTSTVYLSTSVQGIFRNKGNDVYTPEWTPTLGVVDEFWGRSAREIYGVGEDGLFVSSKGDGQWTETIIANGADLDRIWPWNGKLVVGGYWHMYPVP